ncbi:MAG: quinone-dependent dihydroorotate dehydrogenase [Chitinophagales bacterium]|nr:quinone-dependent dihydroorotate dehydrogenase [Chitinophagales bacterium]MDW8273608.1 quinone-dependent dihydroorotate dehydrogenase [Chitinophagales bacterium]
MYGLLKQILFRIDPEKAHHITIQALKQLNERTELLQLLFGKPIVAHELEREFWGLKFKNPVGLAAGLDKNAEVVDQMAALGFGFVEVGTITPLPQPGNEKPRLFRLEKDEALINRMGFNNVGAHLAAARLAKRRTNIPVGVNIGKNKDTSNEQAHKDYLRCFEILYDVADYFVVNVSSPNTPGLRALQDKDSLLRILSELQNKNTAKERAKPLLLKISPDIAKEQVPDILEVASVTKLDGIIATNTTISREGLSATDETIKEIGNGGLSGRPLFQRSTEVLHELSRHMKDSNIDVPLIASGGISDASLAIQKFKAGASLIQLYTGFIYRGPALIREINSALLKESYI